MRVIDADKVYEILESCEIRKASLACQLTEWDYGYTAGIERAESEIECAPTVEAIPISFIEEMKAWAEENDFALYASDLNHLLLTWAERKEE